MNAAGFTGQSQATNNDWRLGVGLLASFIIHIILLASIQTPPIPRVDHVFPQLDVFIMESAKKAPEPMPETQVKKATVSPSKLNTSNPHSSTISNTKLPGYVEKRPENHSYFQVAPDQPDSQLVYQAVRGPEPAVAKDSNNGRTLHMLDIANEIARDDGRKMEKNGFKLDEQHFSHEDKVKVAIEKVFAQNHINPTTSSTTQLADGTVMVSTSYGTKYCFKPQSSYEMGGPLEVTTLASTCP